MDTGVPPLAIETARPKTAKMPPPTIPPIPIAMASLRVILEFTVFLEFISFTLKLVCPNWNFNKTLIVPFDL